MKIDRLLAIVILLINHKKITAQKLAERFEVSVRTIHRDMDAINLAGIPVVAYQGARGGYGIMEHYKLNRQLISLEDVLSIITALKGVNTIMDDRSIDDTIEKMTGLIKNWEIDEDPRIRNHTIIDFTPFGISEQIKEKLKLIRKAVTNSVRIHFTYSDINANVTRRIVEPHSLLFQGYNWYLQAYCRMRQDNRIFRLSRIHGLKLDEKHFTPGKRSFNPNIYDPDKAKPIAIELEFDKTIRVRVQEYFGEDHVHINKDGSIHVKICFPEDEWVYSLILSYGPYVKILKPKHLKDIILARAKTICSLYED